MNIQEIPTLFNHKRKNSKWLLSVLASGCLLLLAFQNPGRQITPATTTINSINSLVGKTSTPTPAPTPTPTPSATIDPSQPVTNKTYAAFFAHSWDIPLPASQADFWIEVDLSDQNLHAYQGSQLLKTFLISSGTSKNPTVPGEFKVYAKYTSYTMRGPGYYLPDVPYSLFFFKGYSIHGTYWHKNFGTPMSHGCINMETGAAEWLYQQAQIGTRVFVHQ